MKKYIKYNLIVLVILSVSCNELDITPPNIISKEDVFKNESAVIAHFANFYSGDPNVIYNINENIFPEMLIEDFNMASTNYTLEQSALRDKLEYFTGYGISRKDADVLGKQGEFINGLMGYPWWNYKAVRNVNEFITLLDEYAANFSPEKVKAWTAEAKVIRAWYYFTMAKRFGGLPIITIAQDVKTPDPETLLEPRASEKETWDYIIKWIDEALEDGMPEINQKGRFDRYAAYTLKAQAALYAASIAKYNSPISGIGNYVDPKTGKQICGIPANEADYYYDIAYKAAYEVIKSRKFNLARGLDSDGSNNFAKLFTSPDKHTECVYAKYYKSPDLFHRWDYLHLPSPYGWGSAFDNPTLDFIDLFDYRDGRSAAVTVNQGEWLPDEYNTCAEIFENRDYRLKGTVYHPGGLLGDENFDVRMGVIVNGTVYAGAGKVTVGGIDYNRRGRFGMGETTTTQTGFLLRKYINESNIKSTTFETKNDQPWLAMRYAEILLIAAETVAETGNDPENIGLASLNDIRTRAGLQPVGSLSIEEVRKQWACEFAFENVVFWCKRRWRVLHETLSNDYQCSALEPYWDITNDKWKFKKAIGCAYPKNSFMNRYYYNQIHTSQTSTNPSIYQNYGY